MGTKVADVLSVMLLEVLSPMVIEVDDGQIVHDCVVVLFAHVECCVFVDGGCRGGCLLLDGHLWGHGKLR